MVSHPLNQLNKSASVAFWRNFCSPALSETAPADGNLLVSQQRVWAEKLREVLTASYSCLKIDTGAMPSENGGNKSKEG